MKLTIVLAITLAMGAFWFVVDHYYQNSNEPNFPCQGTNRSCSCIPKVTQYDVSDATHCRPLQIAWQRPVK